MVVSASHYQWHTSRCTWWIVLGDDGLSQPSIAFLPVQRILSLIVCHASSRTVTQDSFQNSPNHYISPSIYCTPACLPTIYLVSRCMLLHDSRPSPLHFGFGFDVLVPFFDPVTIVHSNLFRRKSLGPKKSANACTAVSQ